MKAFDVSTPEELNYGEDGAKQEPLYTTGGNAN
jgi:hypothetical protein